MRLTKRELAVMRVLWEANEPLTVSEIVERDADGTIDSVQRVVKNLLKKNAVAIEG
ncbi:MAG: BlaI/MecI/CopY family transcriptional regulator, partial [Lachnospiraceae bacterium]|nr:BlaI/MecI/CopY family transcriptional regulator [Lachnospiraceae bacterium]